MDLLPSHFPVAEFGKQNPTVESCPCSHIFLCYFSRTWHPYRDPRCECTYGWVMWQKCSHLVQEGHGEKMLPPVHAAPLSHCQLYQHSSTASLSLGTHGVRGHCVPCGTGNACATGHTMKKPTGSGRSQCDEWMQPRLEKTPRVWVLFHSEQHLQHLITRWRRPSQISNQWVLYSQKCLPNPHFLSFKTTRTAFSST